MSKNVQSTTPRVNDKWWIKMKIKFIDNKTTDSGKCLKISFDETKKTC